MYPKKNVLTSFTKILDRTRQMLKRVPIRGLGRTFIRRFVSTVEITGEWRQYWYQTMAESRRLQTDIGQSECRPKSTDRRCSI